MHPGRQRQVSVVLRRNVVCLLAVGMVAAVAGRARHSDEHPLEQKHLLHKLQAARQWDPSVHTSPELEEQQAMNGSEDQGKLSRAPAETAGENAKLATYVLNPQAPSQDEMGNTLSWQRCGVDRSTFDGVDPGVILGLDMKGSVKFKYSLAVQEYMLGSRVTTEGWCREGDQKQYYDGPLSYSKFYCFKPLRGEVSVYPDVETKDSSSKTVLRGGAYLACPGYTIPEAWFGVEREYAGARSLNKWQSGPREIEFFNKVQKTIEIDAAFRGEKATFTSGSLTKAMEAISAMDSVDTREKFLCYLLSKLFEEHYPTLWGEFAKGDPSALAMHTAQHGWIQNKDARCYRHRLGPSSVSEQAAMPTLEKIGSKQLSEGHSKRLSEGHSISCKPGVARYAACNPNLVVPEKADLDRLSSKPSTIRRAVVLPPVGPPSSNLEWKTCDEPRETVDVEAGVILGLNKTGIVKFQYTLAVQEYMLGSRASTNRWCSGGEDWQYGANAQSYSNYYCFKPFGNMIAYQEEGKFTETVGDYLACPGYTLTEVLFDIDRQYAGPEGEWDSGKDWIEKARIAVLIEASFRGGKEKQVIEKALKTMMEKTTDKRPWCYLVLTLMSDYYSSILNGITSNPEGHVTFSKQKGRWLTGHDSTCQSFISDFMAGKFTGGSLENDQTWEAVKKLLSEAKASGQSAGGGSGYCNIVGIPRKDETVRNRGDNVMPDASMSERCAERSWEIKEFLPEPPKESDTIYWTPLQNGLLQCFVVGPLLVMNGLIENGMRSLHMLKTKVMDFYDAGAAYEVMSGNRFVMNNGRIMDSNECFPAKPGGLHPDDQTMEQQKCFSNYIAAQNHGALPQDKTGTTQNSFYAASLPMVTDFAAVRDNLDGMLRRRFPSVHGLLRNLLSYNENSCGEETDTPKAGSTSPGSGTVDKDIWVKGGDAEGETGRCVPSAEKAWCTQDFLTTVMHQQPVILPLSLHVDFLKSDTLGELAAMCQPSEYFQELRKRFVKQCFLDKLIGHNETQNFDFNSKSSFGKYVDAMTERKPEGESEPNNEETWCGLEDYAVSKCNGIADDLYRQAEQAWVNPGYDYGGRGERYMLDKKIFYDCIAHKINGRTVEMDFAPYKTANINAGRFKVVLEPDDKTRTLFLEYFKRIYRAQVNELVDADMMDVLKDGHVCDKYSVGATVRSELITNLKIGIRVPMQRLIGGYEEVNGKIQYTYEKDPNLPEDDEGPSLLERCRNAKPHGISTIKSYAAAVRLANLKWSKRFISGATINWTPHLFERQLRGLAVLGSVSYFLDIYLDLFMKPDLFVDILLNNYLEKQDGERRESQEKSDNQPASPAPPISGVLDSGKPTSSSDDSGTHVDTVKREAFQVAMKKCQNQDWRKYSEDKSSDVNPAFKDTEPVRQCSDFMGEGPLPGGDEKYGDRSWHFQSTQPRSHYLKCLCQEACGMEVQFTHDERDRVRCVQAAVPQTELDESTVDGGSEGTANEGTDEDPRLAADDEEDEKEGATYMAKNAFRTSDHACLSSIAMLNKAIFNSLEYVALEATTRGALQNQRDASFIGTVKSSLMSTLESIPLIGAFIKSVGETEMLLSHGSMEAFLSKEVQQKFDSLKATLLDMELLFASMDANYESWHFTLRKDLCNVLRMYCNSMHDPKCKLAYRKILQEIPNFGGRCHGVSAEELGFRMDFEQAEKENAILRAPLAYFANPANGLGWDQALAVTKSSSHDKKPAV